MPTDTDTAAVIPRSTMQGQAQRIVESRDLFCGENEILIAHDGSIYRMKITRQGKLILNK